MSSLDVNFMHEVANTPRGKGVLACIQCGRCTSSCPVARVVEEYNPRKLLEMIMLGLRSEIISSSLPWYCLSCFTCLDRCPQGGDVGETVFALRNLALKEGNIPDGILVQAKNLFESGRVVPSSKMSMNRREKYGLNKGFDVDSEAVQKNLEENMLRQTNLQAVVKAMKYAFFLGCLIPEREPSYENSVRKMAPELGIELVEMKGANCCAPFSIQSVDYTSWLALAARNLCIAEQMELNILTLCNDCFESLLTTNTILKRDKEVRDKVNEILSEVNLEFRGKTDVRIFPDALYEDIGIEKVRNAIKMPFNGLRVAVQPGCHLTRPRRQHFGEWIRVTPHMDELVNVTGAISIAYDKKETCCGGPLRGVHDDIALSVAKQKLDSIKAAGVDSIVTICPFCFLELDIGQIEIKRHFNEEYNLPVLHYAELLRMAMGMKLEDWEINAHRISIARILDIKR